MAGKVEYMCGAGCGRGWGRLVREIAINRILWDFASHTKDLDLILRVNEADFNQERGMIMFAF